MSSTVPELCLPYKMKVYWSLGGQTCVNTVLKNGLETTILLFIAIIIRTVYRPAKLVLMFLI